jgi:hypothetical protein
MVLIINSIQNVDSVTDTILVQNCKWIEILKQYVSNVKLE